MRLLFILFFISLSAQNPIASERIIPQNVTEHFLIDTYIGDTLNLHQLLGYYLSFRLSDTINFQLGSSWALTGQYGGYGTATFGPSFNYTHNKTTLFFSPMIGVGGHAALPLGNGQLTHIRLGVQHQMQDHIGLESSLGSLRYTNGKYIVDTISIGFYTNHTIFIAR
jgi:hypothetical protein